MEISMLAHGFYTARRCLQRHSTNDNIRPHKVSAENLAVAVWKHLINFSPDVGDAVASCQFHKEKSPPDVRTVIIAAAGVVDQVHPHAVAMGHSEVGGGRSPVPPTHCASQPCVKLLADERHPPLRPQWRLFDRVRNPWGAWLPLRRTAILQPEEGSGPDRDGTKPALLQFH